MANGLNHRTVNLGSGDEKKILGHKVYLRDIANNTWVLAADLIATQVSWSLAPTIPTASLTRYYGTVRDIGADTTFVDRERIDLDGRMIKIVVELEQFTLSEANAFLNWYGVIDSSVDNNAGLLKPRLPAGVQTFAAFGLEQILRNTIIDEARVIDSAGVDLNDIDTGLTFNDDGKPNRSKNVGPGGYHVFAGGPEWDETTSQRVLEKWTPVKILKYLAAVHPPKDGQGFGILNLALDPVTITGAAGLVPDDTQPTIDADGRSVFDVLNLLMNPSTLLAWNLKITDTPGALLTATIVAHSLTPNTGLPVPNSPNTVDLNAEDDPLTTLTVEHASVERVDQVVIRGPKQVFIFSAPLDSGQATTLKPLERDWTDEEIEQYETLIGPGTGTLDEQRRLANEIRESPKYRDVFALFRIGRDWEGRTYTPASLPQNVIVTNTGAPYKPFRGAVRILPTLPEEFIDANPRERPRRNPIVICQRPDDVNTYIQGDAIQSTLDVGDLDSQSSSRMTIEAVAEGDRNLRVIVSGEPQHSIAGSEFTAQDFDREYPAYDYKKTWVTMAVETELWVERRYPTNPPVYPGKELRRKIIRLGDLDQFKVIRVAEGTIESVDTDGTLNYATAGLLVDGAADDSVFDKVGKILYDYYTTTRRKVSVWTHRIADDLRPGDLLLKVSQQYDVDDDLAAPVPIVANSIINEITLDMPLGAGEEAGSRPLLRMTTYEPSDIDPVAVIDGVEAAMPVIGNAAQGQI